MLYLILIPFQKAFKCAVGGMRGCKIQSVKSEIRAP